MSWPKSILGLLLVATACFEVPVQNSTPVAATFIGPDHPGVVKTGRFLATDSGFQYAWTGSRLDFRFAGDSCTIQVEPLAGIEYRMPDSLIDYYQLLVNGRSTVVSVKPEDNGILITGEGDTTTVTLVKRTEAAQTEGLFRGIRLAPGARLLSAPELPDFWIEAIGNSITCGYGNEGSAANCPFSPETENGWMTYAAIAARELGANLVPVCYSGRGVFQNYDKTREMTMRDWWLRYSPRTTAEWGFGNQPDIVLINLGTNDFAHGIPPREGFVAAYKEFLGMVRSRYPDATIVCLTGSMMQKDRLETLTRWLDVLVEEIHEAGDQQVFRLDLSPQGDLGYGCDWHPNIAQHQKNAQELVSFLGHVMGFSDQMSE